MKIQNKRLHLGRAQVLVPARQQADSESEQDDGDTDRSDAMRRLSEIEEVGARIISLSGDGSIDVSSRHYSRLSEAADANGDAILLFVHGFKTSFEDSIRQTARIAVDLNFQRQMGLNAAAIEATAYGFGQPAVFTWHTNIVPARDLALAAASGGRIGGRAGGAAGAGLGALTGTALEAAQQYKESYDTRAPQAAAALEAYLKALVGNAQPKKLNIIAHSMGNRVLAGALPGFAAWYANQQGDGVEIRIMNVAADIDHEAFNAAMDDVEAKLRSAPTNSSAAKSNNAAFPKSAIYLNKTDRILGLSSFVNGKPRLGQHYPTTPPFISDNLSSDDVDDPRYHVVDATGFSPATLGVNVLQHDYLDRSPTILADLACFMDGRPLFERSLDETPVAPAQGPRIWRLSPTADKGLPVCRARPLPPIDCDGYFRWVEDLRGVFDVDVRARLERCKKIQDDPVGHCDELPEDQKPDWCWAAQPPSCTEELVEETETPDPMRVTVYFDRDASTLTDVAKRDLTMFWEAARRFDGDIASISIVGHTDTKKPNKYNDALSLRRAEAVRAFLGALADASQRISVEGLGESDLAVLTQDDVREPRNRRVEVTIEFKPVVAAAPVTVCD